MVSNNESSETSGSASSSVSEDSINVSFDDIKFSVRNGLFTRGRKEILKGVSGTFNAGELTVIMGQSGAGKSTLIDILAGYTKPSSGTIFVNGQPRDDRWFRRRSCYIMQDCLLHDMLTVRESLMVAANLKLGQHVSRAQKIKRVEEVILALGLSAAVNTRAGNLSGGQKKRLAISLELVSDPRVMIIDEPTSGLDSSLSKQLVYLLHLLAGQGRTVIVSIHQPSAGLLQMMDRIYAVMAGRCAYNGSVTQLVPYLNHLGLVCPPFHNPVDFLIETYSENEDRLVQAAQSGRNAWISDISSEKDNNMLAFNISSKLNEELCISALPTLKESRTNKLLLRIQSTYSTSRWRQFSTLTKKSFLTTWRDPTHSLMNVLIHAGMALFVGILFYDIGEDASFIRDNFNFLYFSLMFIMFTSFSAVSINFPQEIPVVRREHFNRWYSASSYYAATIASCLPKHTIGALIYACLTFWMTGQPVHMLRFLGFSAMLTAVSYVSMFVGFLNGSMFNVKNGVIFGPFILMPLTIFSGFFLRLVDAPSYIKWFFHASFLKHGLVGLLLSIFGMDRPKMPCSDLYCHYAHPKQFLEDNGCSKESYANAMLALFLTTCSVAICSFWVLKIRLRRKW